MDVINAFIAHHHNDEKWIEPFKNKAGKHCFIRDSSIVETEPNNANNPDYIKAKYLRPSIDWAGHVFVFVSKDTKVSNPECGIEWEVDYAFKNGKTISVIYLPGATEADLTPNLEEYADNYIRWDNDKGIIDAINGNVVSDAAAGGIRTTAGGSGMVC